MSSSSEENSIVPEEEEEDQQEQESVSSDEEEHQRLAEEEAKIKELLKHTSYETLLKLRKQDNRISEFSKKIKKEGTGPKSLAKSKTNASKTSSSKPKERNARIPVSRFKTIVETQRPKGRDPRFDGLSGTLNNDLYKKSYSFLVDQKKEEIKTLEHEIQKAKGKKKKYSEEDIGKLRQALGKNKEEMNRFKSNEEKDDVRREHKKKLHGRGDNVFYLKKGEFKKKLLERKFEELDKSNKLNKVLDRKKKRQSQKIGIEFRKVVQKTQRKNEMM